MRNVRRIGFFFCVPITGLAWGQEPAKRITNQDVIETAKLGLSNEVIIAKIRSVNGANALKFDTSVEGLKGLKEAGVPDEVIKVMINPAPPAPPVVTTSTTVNARSEFAASGNRGVLEGRRDVCVHSGAGHQFREGRAGAFFTDGIRSEHWDATLNGPTSNNRIKDRRPVFYLYVPEGASGADHGHRGTGDDVERASGVVIVHAEHVGIRTYKLTLDADLKPGEYAFFRRQRFRAGIRFHDSGIKKERVCN